MSYKKPREKQFFSKNMTAICFFLYLCIMVKISVLVPIYGVEKYIGEFATSLFEQTYKDLECIFVDDCSPDGSMAVLKEVMGRYPSRESQVRIIHHEKNRGLGAARATALNAATGEYVMVADSDDVLPRDAIEKLVQKQQETGADMVDGAFRRLTSEGLTSSMLPFHGSKEQMLRMMLLQNTIHHSLWGRLVRRSIYTDNGINSIEGVNMAEDFAVTPRLLYCCTRSYTDDIVYHYRLNTQSTFVNQMSSKNLTSYLKAHQAVGSFFREHDKAGRFRWPMHISKLLVFFLARRGGMTYRDTMLLSGYRLSPLARLLFFRPLLPVLRLLYLTEKRLYLTAIGGNAA